MVEYSGISGNLALFVDASSAVVVDLERNAVLDMTTIEALTASASWETPETEAPAVAYELAAAALSSLDAAITASGDRMYTIPGGAQAEAKKALAWRKEHKRGGTPVGLNTARTLAKGGQIGIQKIRHIAKFFPRHEKNKQAKGWKPGEDGFPSNGRIAWALWGGDAAWRWASAIVERENKKALAAGGFTLPGYKDDFDVYSDETSYDADINAFKIAHELDPYMGPEFMARVRLDNSGIDRLYKVDVDGMVYLWDGSAWDDMGHVDGDVYLYDSALDDPEDTVEKTHVIIDPSSAVIISAFLQERPFQPVSLDELDPEETSLMAEGLVEEDFGMIDRVLTAAGISAAAGDGVDTPEEKGERADKQPRDASGKFAQKGTNVVIADDYSRGTGKITAINAKDGTVDVLLNNGKTVTVPADQTKENKGGAAPGAPVEAKPLDLSGILGEPKTPTASPKANLPGGLKPLTASEIGELMTTGWDSWVSEQRQKAKPVTAAADAETEQTPESSDISPKYLALVSPDDHRAVMDLVAIVPKTATSTTPVVYERKDGQWVPNAQILADLKSVSPPPVVELKGEELINDVLVQVDDLKKDGVQASAYDFAIFWEKRVEPLLAAGGLDRNRGNAEKLRRYWTRGKGAAKIRWGTPGDWTRCVRQLSKYMGPRAKGYCQLRHKDATGVYTGSRANPGRRKGRTASAAMLFSSSVDFETKMLHHSELSARASDAREKVSLVAAAPRLVEGSKFFIPMLIPEELESGDGRKFKSGSVSMRELPVPLLWQIKTGSGHDGSVVVGRIDYIERIEGGMGNAYGVFDSGPYGREAERLVRNGFLRGVSVDLDQFEATEEKQPKAETSKSDSDSDGDISKDKITVNKARIMAATIVAKPAFQECTISIVESGDQEDTVTPEDGVYEESLETFADVEPITASGYLESEIPAIPPHAWFENPKLTKPTPLTIDADGKVYGHIAAWHVSHIGLPRSTKPPRSRSNYAYFHTGVCRTDSGKDVPVGQLTLAGGHAPLNADAASAAKHYDDTASAIADVHVGEDQYGIWCAGSLRPGVDEMQIRALRASAPSGDWRPINGSLELVAVCQVNVPGFPIARAMVAGGKMMALVAAGASEMAIMKSRAVGSLVAKADLLGQLSATAPDLKKRVREAKRSLRENSIQALTASAAEMREKALVAAAVAELAKISEEERMELAKKGHALSDGAYPIRNEEDLKNAIQAYGRSKPSERKMVRKHIIKRARQLKKADLIPSNWANADSMEAAAAVEAMKASITAAAAKSEFADTPKDEISDSDLEELKKAKEEADKQTEEEIKRAEDIRTGKTTVEDKFDEDGRQRYVSGVNQPRDAKGKYRKVLARLKQDLGVAGLSRALTKVQEAENLDFMGNYAASAEASNDLLGMIDRLDSGALNARALENVRLTAAELGKTIANLPLPFGREASKLKFSDLPAGLKNLIEKMVDRVEAKIGKKDADIATQNLRSYMSGADVYSQGEVQSEMSKLLRLLT